jgi:hypothetical protein
LLGLLALAYMSGGSILKALAMAVLGLLLGMIGIDPMTGFFRFAYGVVELATESASCRSPWAFSVSRRFCSPREIKRRP